MTIIDDRVLPARPAQVGLATDTSSTGALRPFGLALATPLAQDEGVVVLDDATYDPAWQDDDEFPAASVPPLDRLFAVIEEYILTVTG